MLTQEEQVAVKSIHMEERILLVQESPPASPVSSIKFTIKNTKRKRVEGATLSRIASTSSLTAPNSPGNHREETLEQQLSSAAILDEFKICKQRRSTPVKLEPLHIDDGMLITKQEIEKFTVQRKKPKQSVLKNHERQPSLLRQLPQVKKAVVRSKLQGQNLHSSDATVKLTPSSSNEDLLRCRDEDLFYSSEEETSSIYPISSTPTTLSDHNEAPLTSIAEDTNSQEQIFSTVTQEKDGSSSAGTPSALHLLYERKESRAHQQQGLFHQVNLKGSTRKPVATQHKASVVEQHLEIQSLYHQHVSNNVYQWNHEKKRYVAIFRDVVAWKTFDLLDEVSIEEQFFSKRRCSTLPLLYPYCKNELEWEKQSIVQEKIWKSWQQRMRAMLRIQQVLHRDKMLLQRQKRQQEQNTDKPQRKMSKLEFQKLVVAPLQPNLENVLVQKIADLQVYSPAITFSSSSTAHPPKENLNHVCIPIIMQPIEEDFEVDHDMPDWNGVVRNPTKKVEGISRRKSALPNYFSIQELCTKLLQIDDSILVEAFSLTSISIASHFELLQCFYATLQRLHQESQEQALEITERFLHVLLHWMTFSIHQFLEEECVMGLVSQIISHIAQLEETEESLRLFLDTLVELTKNPFEINNSAKQRLVYVVDLQPTTRFSVTNFPAHVLAIQLSLIEQDMYCLMRPEELLQNAWMKQDKQDKAPHVLALIKKFNLISQWVIWSIVSCNAVWDRAQVLSHWILFAWECLQLRNFSACFEIISGLCSNPVYRLQRTWMYLSKYGRQLCDTMQQMTTIAQNYRNYRVALQQAATPLIPNIAVHLKDLAALEDAQTSTRRKEEGMEFNMTKREMQSVIMKQLWDYQSVRYPFAVDEKCRRFIWYELVKLGDRDAKEFHAEMMRVSKQLESK